MNALCFHAPCQAAVHFHCFGNAKLRCKVHNRNCSEAFAPKKFNQRANTATTARDSCCVDSAGARQRSAIEKTKRLLRGSNPGPPAKNVGVITTRPSSLAKWHANVQLNLLKFAEKTAQEQKGCVCLVPFELSTHCGDGLPHHTWCVKRNAQWAGCVGACAKNPPPPHHRLRLAPGRA